MSSEDRLLTFEVAGTIYALPIGGVIEVAEGGRVTCVPTLPADSAGVMTWHGDALPVVAPRHLFADDAIETRLETEHVLVVSDRDGESARLGMPIDRVFGLVDGAGGRRASGELIVERRRVRGRVVSVLDPGQLVARAEGVIESAVQ